MPRLSPAAILVLTVMLAGCAAGPAANVTATSTPASEPNAVAMTPALPAERLAFWRSVHADGDRVPAGQRAEDLVPELETMLAAIDPAIRDDLAYNIFEAWILRAKLLGPEALRGLTRRLSSRLVVPADTGETDAIFGEAAARHARG